MRTCLLACLALSACAGAVTPTGQVTESESGTTIPNFAMVSAGLYRGGHPDDDGLAYLQQIGVKTIVDLEIGDFIEAWPWDITHERKSADALGFDFVRQPMSAFTPFVSDEEMDATLAILADSSRQPIFVHCKHGQDRTGLVIGLERVFNEGWAPADAYQEMLDYGFHTAFVGLNHYFEEKTGYED
jgi:protein tyrosine/serine phosphatase